MTSICDAVRSFIIMIHHKVVHDLNLSRYMYVYHNEWLSRNLYYYHHI